TRLEQRLPVLTGGPRDVPDRQETVLATIEWSYLFLDSHEQEVLRRRRVFVVGWDASAAEHVSVTTLGALVYSRGDSLRFHEVDAAVELLQSIWRLWLVRGPLSGGQLWTEKVLAIEGVETSCDFGWLLGLSADFPRFLGDHLRARALLERSIEVLTRTGETFRLASSIHSLAAVTEHLGDPDGALALNERCLAIGREINQPSTIAHALNGLAVSAFRRGDYARMAAFAEEELALNRRVGAGIPESLHNVAEARRRLGQLESSAQLYVEGLALSLELGDLYLIAEFLDGLADLAAARSDFRSEEHTSELQ